MKRNARNINFFWFLKLKLYLTQSQTLPSIVENSITVIISPLERGSSLCHAQMGRPLHQGSLACPGCHSDTQCPCSQPMLPPLCAWDMGLFNQSEPCLSSCLQDGTCLPQSAPLFPSMAVESCFLPPSIRTLRGNPTSSFPSSRYPAQSIQ